MIVFSRFVVVTAIVLFSESSLAKSVVWLDTQSNGRYWWGKPWTHEPAHGDTNDCLCIKAVRKKTNKPEVVHCWTKGIDKKDGSSWFGYTCPFGCGNGDAYIMDDIDADKPIDITTFGTDGLWIDRMFVETGAPKERNWWERNFGGHKARIYGADNTAGWCLSKDKNDNSFDKWSTVPAGRCFTTLSLRRDKKVMGTSSATTGTPRSTGRPRPRAPRTTASPGAVRRSAFRKRQFSKQKKVQTSPASPHRSRRFTLRSRRWSGIATPWIRRRSRRRSTTRCWNWSMRQSAKCTMEKLR